MLIVIGAFLMLSPFSGFPLALLTWFYLFVGLLTALIGLSFRLARKRRARRESHEAAPVLS